MKPKLFIITGNNLKFREISKALESFFDCEQKNIEGYHEIQGTPQEILMHKLLASYGAFKAPVLVDDTSTYFSALNGFPGPYFKDFVSVMTPYEMGVKFAGTRIKIECQIAIAFDPSDIVVGVGIAEGDIIKPKSAEDHGRQLDLFTVVDGTDKPMIESSPEEKNVFSHRGLAVKDLLKKLAERK